VVIRAVSKWLLRGLFANAPARRFLDRELAKAHPLLDNPQFRYAPPGHFYSPLPDTSILDREIERLYPCVPVYDGISLNADGQRRLFSELAASAAGFDWPEEQTAGRRFWLKNGRFEHGDALILFSMIRHFAPRRIIEVGSGFTSALMLDTNELHCQSRMRLTFIEPNPERFHGLLRPHEKETTDLIVAPVQSVSLDTFDLLDANDFLFIDSSHVSKIGSDVNHLLFSVLPRLRPGVVVHFHDIFYPFEYPAAWVRKGRAWNELYLLRAFLQYNSAFDIVLFNSYLAFEHQDLVKRLIPRMNLNPGGSIWLRKLDPSRAES
jgi:predicted O-methyltransferase YrrM